MCWKFKHSQEILPCCQRGHCMCTSECWHTNTHVFTPTLQLFRKRTVPLQVLKVRKEMGECTALPQPGHAPLLQPQRQPALTSKSVLLQVLSSPCPRLWEHHPKSCITSWAADTSGVWAWATPALALPQWQCHQPQTKDNIFRARDATREIQKGAPVSIQT